MGTLIHEIKHAEFPYRHVKCTHLPPLKDQYACDSTLEHEHIAFHLLLEEIQIRKKLTQLKKPISLVQKERLKKSLIVNLVHECKELKRIVHLPGMDPNAFSCESESIAAKMLNDKDIFGL